MKNILIEQNNQLERRVITYATQGEEMGIKVIPFESFTLGFQQ